MIPEITVLNTNFNHLHVGIDRLEKEQPLLAAQETVDLFVVVELLHQLPELPEVHLPKMDDFDIIEKTDEFQKRQPVLYEYFTKFILVDGELSSFIRLYFVIEASYEQHNSLGKLPTEEDVQAGSDKSE